MSRGYVLRGPRRFSGHRPAETAAEAAVTAVADLLFDLFDADATTPKAALATFFRWGCGGVAIGMALSRVFGI